jgi:hypothetical protein
MKQREATTVWHIGHSPARINNSNILRHAHSGGAGDGCLKHGHALGVRYYVALEGLLAFWRRFKTGVMIVGIQRLV